jgi:hypothetical protein
LSVVSGQWSLVIGYWSLVIGHWSLVIGYWLLVIGYWLLVIGYWLLVIGKILSPPVPCSLIKYLKMGKVVIMFCVVAAKILYRGYQKLIVVVDLFGFVLAIRHILRA